LLRGGNSPADLAFLEARGVATMMTDHAPPSSSRVVLSFAALVLGVVALGLAIVPRAWFGAPPPPWPEQTSAPPPSPPPVVEGGVTFKVKGMQVNIGGKTPPAPPPAPVPLPEPVPMTAKSFAAATAVVALLGAFASALACWRERSYILAIPGAGMCCAAILWHYIVLGVIFGIGILIVIAVLYALVSP
jgi:hypothetical protein